MPLICHRPTRGPLPRRLISIGFHRPGRAGYKEGPLRQGFLLPTRGGRRGRAKLRRRSSVGQSEGLRSVLDEGTIMLWNDLYNLTDGYTDGWLSSARTILDQILNGRKCTADGLELDNANNFGVPPCENINFLVTSGSLIPSLVKCLLFRFDGLISHENVYSSWEVGKLQCFRWIKERFKGAEVKFCAIGDGMEECRAAEVMQWPFVKVDFRPGGTHRFPGLTKTMLRYYMDVIYGESNAEDSDDI